MRYFLRMLCPAGHETRTELFHAEVQADGSVSGSAGSDADYCAVCGVHTEVQDCEAEVSKTCQWYALCDRPVAVNLPHPVLGLVPTCQPCADKVAALSA